MGILGCDHNGIVMATLFAQLKARPLLFKAVLILVYGAASFAFVYLIGTTLLANFLLFRIFEFLWFVHIVIIANQLSYGSSDLITLAVLGLSAGLINNLWLVLSL
jgi:hypothetical protein